MKRFFMIFIILTMFCGISFAVTYPEPQGRLVNDFTGTLSVQQRDSIEKILRDYEQKTTNEIAIVIIPDLQGENVDMYAVKLFEKWKIGKKGKDNGLLFLLSMKERKWRFEVGYGLEGAINDGKCGHIAREFMVPHFKKGNFAFGITEGLTAIMQNIEASKIVPVNKTEDKTPLSDDMIFLIIVGIVFLSLLTFGLLYYLKKQSEIEDDLNTAPFIPSTDSTIPVITPPLQVYTTKTYEDHDESKKQHSHHDDDDSYRSSSSFGSSSSSDSFSSGIDFGGGSSGGGGCSGDF